ncbi:MAG TPA: MOSC domain-containing protein [Acidimicrobiales bacterium]
MGELLGRVVSVNVGLPRTVEWQGRSWTSAIWKEPVDGPIGFEGEYLAGDAVADPKVHGRRDKAVYAYAREDYAWWATELPDTDFHPGLFGENLTTEGIDLAAAVIGERWQVGGAVLEVAQPRFPCAKLGMRMGDASFRQRFDKARRSGSYFRVVDPGPIGAGDEVVRLAPPPEHGITIGDVVAARFDAPAEVMERILALDIATDNMRQVARLGLERLQKA